MTSTDHPTQQPARPRTLRDDLLDDLLRAAPMPARQPTADSPTSVPAERPDATDPGTPTLELRLTPRRWSAPSMRPLPRGAGLVVCAGPVRVSLTGFGS
jgi:hypothetical protein